MERRQVIMTRRVGRGSVTGNLTAANWLSTLYTAGLASVVGYTVWNTLMARHSPARLVEAAREVVLTDLATGDVAVLVELLVGCRSRPAMAAEVAARLDPWHDLARSAVERAVGAMPLGPFAPVTELAHAVVAGILGLELLALASGSQTQAIALIDRLTGVVGLLEVIQAAPTKGQP